MTHILPPYAPHAEWISSTTLRVTLMDGDGPNDNDLFEISDHGEYQWAGMFEGARSALQRMGVITDIEYHCDEADDNKSAKFYTDFDFGNEESAFVFLMKYSQSVDDWERYCHDKYDELVAKLEKRAEMEAEMEAENTVTTPECLLS